MNKLFKNISVLVLCVAVTLVTLLLPTNSLTANAAPIPEGMPAFEPMASHNCSHLTNYHVYVLSNPMTVGTSVVVRFAMVVYYEGTWQVAGSSYAPVNAFSQAPSIGSIYYIEDMNSIALLCEEVHSKSEDCTHNYVWKTTKEPTLEEDGILSMICADCGSVEKTQPINNDMVVYEAYANELEEQLRKGDAIKLDLKAWHSVPAFLMERIISCGKDVELIYKYQGVKYDITIKAGQGQNLNIPWYGPLLMNSLYGN